ISLFFFNLPPPTEIYTLSLHDALPISVAPRFLASASAAATNFFAIPRVRTFFVGNSACRVTAAHKIKARSKLYRVSIINFLTMRSEEHTSELQSRGHLVCRLLLEKKKK